MKRILCIWLPEWPLQRIIVTRPELKRRPLVLSEIHRGAPRVAACSMEARALGIAVGMPLAEARMLAGGERGPGRQSPKPGLFDPLPRRRAPGWTSSGDLQVVPYDPMADREALKRLAEWCQRFSPLVGLEDGPAPSSLLLDVTGLEPLFGNEASLAGQIVRDFAQQGLAVRVAVSDTLGASWALAHFGEGGTWKAESGGEGAAINPQGSVGHLPFPMGNPFLIVPAGQHAAALRPLPVEALRLPEEHVDLLRQLGIYRIGQLEALPRQDLTVRFGSQLLERLDQAVGRLAEPVPAEPLPPKFEAERSLEHATTRRETIELVLEELISRLAEGLIRAGRGAVQLECRLCCEGAQEAAFFLGLFRPTASAKHLSALIRMRLERIALPAAVSTLHVRAAVTAPLSCLQQELFADGPRKNVPRHLADLVDRLSSRLGRKAVVGVRLLNDAQPELAYQYDPLVDDARRRVPRNPVWRTQRPDLPPRPLRLIRRPVPLDAVSVLPDGPPLRFHWHRGEHRIAHTWGPERIETGWWRGRTVGRDYWRIETTAGSRFWLFRRLRDEKWFLHGTFE